MYGQMMDIPLQISSLLVHSYRDPGATEIDTRRPHWLGSTGDGPVEVLALYGRQGERVHMRGRS